MKAKEHQDTAITSEAAVESEATVIGEESTAMEQAVMSGAENAAEMAAAESAGEDQPHGEAVQEAATHETTDFAEIYRARLIESAKQSARLMNEYGASLARRVPSATEGIGQLVNLYHDIAQKRIADWYWHPKHHKQNTK